MAPHTTPFGWLRNDIFTRLTNNTKKSQQGSYSVFVNAGDTFGFRQIRWTPC